MLVQPAYRFLVWLPLLSLLLAVAHGQDALFSSLALDQSTAAETLQLSDQPSFGPVQWSAGAYADTSYNDNINGAADHPEADVISGAGLNLSLSWQATPNSTLLFGTGIGYLDYFKYTADSGIQITPDSALTYAVSLDDVLFTFFDQFSCSRNVQSQPSLANVATLLQLNNNLGLRVEWDPGQWVLLASYSHDDFASDHANDFLNRSSEYAFARAGWRFAESTQAGMEASGTWTSYQIAEQNNNQNLSLGGYLEWMVRPSLNVTFRGGPVFYNAQPGANAGASSVDSYYVSVEVTHQINDFLSEALDVERSLQSGLNLGGSYFEQLSASYSFSWAVTQRIRLSASAAYTDGQQSLADSYVLQSNGQIAPALNQESYQQYSGGCQAAWQATDHLGAEVGFNHLLRDSNLAGRTYSENVLSLQFNYSF